MMSVILHLKVVVCAVDEPLDHCCYSTSQQWELTLAHRDLSIYKIKTCAPLDKTF